MELEFTGAVTNAEFYAQIATGEVSKAGEVYTINDDIRIMAGCSLANFRNIIIQLNNHSIHIDEGATDYTWRDILFIESGPRRVGERFVFPGDLKYRAIGGGFIHNIAGQASSGDRRYLTQIEAESLSNVRITATDFPLQEVDSLEFVESTEIDGLFTKRVKIIAAQGIGTNVIIHDLVQASKIYTEGGLTGTLHGASLMVNNYINEKYPRSATDAGRQPGWHWDNQGNDGIHWLHLLGTAASVFLETGIIGRSDKLNVTKGAMKLLQVYAGGVPLTGFSHNYFNSSSMQQLLYHQHL